MKKKNKKIQRKKLNTGEDTKKTKKKRTEKGLREEHRRANNIVVG